MLQEHNTRFCSFGRWTEEVTLKEQHKDDSIIHPGSRTGIPASLLMPQRLMFSLGAINNVLFPLPRKVLLHDISPHICYRGLIIRPEPTCHAPSNVGIGHLRNTGAFAARYAIHPLCALAHWAWEQRESHPHHMNQALWQGSVGCGITRRITSLSFYCSLSHLGRLGTREARWSSKKAYISVDEEINQIISGVRKGAQRAPSWSSPFEM